MSVFARLARVAPLAPLAGVVSILSVLALGAPPGMVRQRRRGARMLRRYAGRCGAYRGQVVERRTGAGVVGSDPCWETVTGLWQGDIAEVAAEVARAVRDAGYDWDSGVRAGSKRRWQGTRRAPPWTSPWSRPVAPSLGRATSPSRDERGAGRSWSGGTAELRTFRAVPVTGRASVSATAGCCPRSFRPAALLC